MWCCILTFRASSIVMRTIRKQPVHRSELSVSFHAFTVRKTVSIERQTLRLSRQRRRMADKDNRSGLLWSTQRWNVSVWYLFTISPQARKAAVRACDMPIEIIFCFMRNHIKESLHELPKPWYRILQRAICLYEEMCAICRLIYFFFLRSFSNRILTQTKKRQKSIKNAFGMFGIYQRLRCFEWKNFALHSSYCKERGSHRLHTKPHW